MILLLSLAQAAAAQVAVTAPPEMSPQARLAIAPVAAAIAKVRAAQARLPVPRNDAERLRRMGDLDQAAHGGLGRIDVAAIPPADRPAALVAVRRQVDAVDRANQQALLAMLPPEGWFTVARYGPEASRAAFLIVQHADPDLMRRFVPALEPLAAKGEIPGGEFALMYDRLALSEGRRQRYGSQVKCEAGKWVTLPLEDPETLDQRRAAVGLGPHADYLAKSYGRPLC